MNLIDYIYDVNSISPKLPKILLADDMCALKNAYQKKIQNNQTVANIETLKKRNFDRGCIAVCPFDSCSIKVFRLYKDVSFLCVKDVTKFSVNSPIRDMLIHPSLGYLLVCQEDGNVSIFSFGKKQIIQSFNFNIDISGFGIDPSGLYIMVASKISDKNLQNPEKGENSKLMMCEIVNGRIFEAGVFGANKIDNLCWSNNGRYAIMGNEMGRVNVFEISDKIYENILEVWGKVKQSLFWWDWCLLGDSFDDMGKLARSFNTPAAQEKVEQGNRLMDQNFIGDNGNFEGSEITMIHENPYYQDYPDGRKYGKKFDNVRKSFNKTDSQNFAISNRGSGNHNRSIGGSHPSTYLKDIKKMSDLYPKEYIPGQFTNYRNKVNRNQNPGYQNHHKAESLFLTGSDPTFVLKQNLPNKKKKSVEIR